MEAPDPAAKTSERPAAVPVVVAIDMGYGHLRAAAPIAERLGTTVLDADRPPLADAAEQKQWARVRGWYGSVTRLSQVPLVGAPLRRVVDNVTHIPPLHPLRDLSRPNAGARALERLARRGLGRGLVEHLRATGAPLLTTFYSPAILADRARCDGVFCVVTDSDINRVWAPFDPASTRIRYLCPTPRALRRLRAYGVPESNLVVTGFPLPHSLLGGRELTALKHNLAARLVRLDPTGSFRDTFGKEVEAFCGPLPVEEERGAPPLVVFAVGGTGAQTGVVRRFLPSLRAPILEGAVRLALVAGIRGDTAAALRTIVEDANLTQALGHGLELLHEPDVPRYFEKFDALLARADVLWTKPSEMTFYGALGLPMIFSHPIGVHERYNRRWAIESGVGFKQRELHATGSWLSEYLHDGTLAAAAWSGAMRMPKSGLYRTLDELAGAGRPGGGR